MQARNKKEKLIVGNQELQEIFDVSAEMISRWTKAGMPKSTYGKYDLKQTLSWWLENVYSGRDSKEVQNARDRYWEAKAEEAEVKVAVLKEELIPQKEILQNWSTRVLEVKQGLLSLPVKLPPLLEGKTREEIKTQVKTEVVRLLDSYAREGKFCPKTKK